MKAEHKLARQKFSVLELAEAVGNVSEACRRRGISPRLRAQEEALLRPTGWRGSRTYHLYTSATR